MRRIGSELWTPEIPEIVGSDPIFDFRSSTGGRSVLAIGEEGYEPAVIDRGPIDAAQLLIDRPDVLAAYYVDFYSDNNDRHSHAWFDRVGGVTPEAYGLYWYETQGRAEGYVQGEPSTVTDRIAALNTLFGEGRPVEATFDGLPLVSLLAKRPDVLRAYYEGYYGDGNDRHSSAWVKRVGGDTPEAYANYWYEKHGRWEGVGNGTSSATEQIDVERLLTDRPDVFRKFYEEFYGPGNDRKSSAWVDRVGGETVQDYAKYWYVTYGQREGYTQRQPQIEEPRPEEQPLDPPSEDEAPVDASPEETRPDETGPEEMPPEAAPEQEAPVEAAPEAGPSADVDPPSAPAADLAHDPAEDPWNHPDEFPDWAPPYEDWAPPPNPWHMISEADFFG